MELPNATKWAVSALGASRPYFKKTQQYLVIGFKAKIEMLVSRYPHRKSETHPSKGYFCTILNN